MDKIDRVFEIIRNDGIKALWIKFLDWAKIYRRLLIFERDYRKETLAGPETKLYLEIRLLQENEVGMYKRLNPEVNESEIIKRLEEGHLCFVSIHGGAIIAYTWSAVDKAHCEYLDCFLFLQPNMVYNYDAFVSPDYRGYRVAAAQYLYKMKYLLENQYFRPISLILLENSASIKHIKRTGGKNIGTMGYVKIGPWKKYFSRLKPEFSDKEAIAIERI